MSQKFNPPPLENALDFINSGLHFISSSKNKVRFGIVHLAIGTEILIKDILVRENWAFIFKNLDKADRSAYVSGDFTSVTINSAFKRIKGILGKSIESEAIIKLAKIRNKVVHFTMTESEEAVKSIAADALSDVLEIIRDFYGDKSLTSEEDELLKEIRMNLSDFQEFIGNRIEYVDQIISESDFEFIIKCPICYKDYFVLDDEQECLFCGHTNEPTELAKEYVEEVLHISYILQMKDDPYNYPIRNCPECGFESLVTDIEFYHEQNSYKEFLCFNCLSSWEADELSECTLCGSLHSGDGAICNDCFQYKMEQG